jgi:outer membrane biosynthesis protein TonB
MSNPEALTASDQNRGLRWSFGLHAAVAAFVLVKGLFFPGNPLPYVPTLRVDLVGLPDTLKNDLSKISKAPMDKELADALKRVEQKPKDIVKVKPLDKEEAPKETDELGMKPQAKPKDNSKAREKKLMSALDRIKALEAVEDSDTPKATKAASVAVKGNKVSKGSSLSGEARESDQVQYYDLLKSRLQENWSLPVWLARQQYGAQVILFIDNHGNLRAYRFNKSSGNSQFDDAVKRAIQQSVPFDPPPDSIASTVYTNGVVVGFPL